ncbi:carbohydrate sulfotransferase 1-like [Asterias amurensis]|uniref:carbohydrate sulfotransferase 1-like n=1 Tax=Asterias amurensis TaxID=7602 RepID=UPI003AB5AD52
MYSMNRGFVYVMVACSLVLLSILTYTQVLSHHMVRLSHRPLETPVARGLLGSNHSTRFVNKTLNAVPIEVLDTMDMVHQREIFNQTNATLVNKGTNPWKDPRRVSNLHQGLKVIVLARMRTGSTLLGEIFNQNQQLMYLFEPLHATDSMVKMGLMTPNKMNVAMRGLLGKLAHCTFPTEFMHDMYKWSIGKAKSTTLHGICKATSGCAEVVPGMLVQSCRQHKGNMAMKLIRADLDTVQPLITNDKLNVKIIHLIRDPRGTANSRKGYYCPRKKIPAKDCTLDNLKLLEHDPDNFKFNTVHKLCRWMRKTVPLALQRPEWLRGRYKLIRYEDLAADPFRLTQDIYDFLGLPMQPEVTQWVKTNTQENTSKSTNTFSTKKNSSEASMHWRSLLSFKEVKDIERKCGDVMEMLGYLPITSEDELTNYNVPVTLPLNIGTDISFV